MADLTKFRVKEETSIVEALQALHNHQNPTNWVLLGYQTKTEVSLTGSGSGGLDEFRSKLVNDQIQYGILELTVQGDEYNPIKFVLLTWIGPKISSGIIKARASAHRADVLTLVQKGVTVSCQHQAESLEEVTYEQLAQAISRYRPTYGSSAPASGTRQNMSRSSAAGGGAHSAFNVVNRDEVVNGLRTVFEEKADWAVLAYVVGKKDEVEIVSTGKGGIDSLKQEFPTDRIFYGYLRLKFKTSAGDSINKFILVTMVGANVPPLQKARSSAQRRDVSDFVISVVQLSGHFQPNDPDELTMSALQRMFQE